MTKQKRKQKRKSKTQAGSAKKGDVVSQIFRAITEKGWNCYSRGSFNTRISLRETLQRGPVGSLQLGVSYDIIPKVDDPTSDEAIGRFVKEHQVMPRITVPKNGFRYFGRAIYQCPGETELTELLKPGDEIDLVRIELLVREIRLFARRRDTQCTVVMFYQIFQTALRSLQDIKELESGS